VVIGILIALSINNWNEDQKEQVVLKSYYKQILNDFDREKNYVQERISFLNKSTSSYETYMKVFEKSNLEINDIFSFIGKVEYESTYFEFNTNTIQTLQNTREIKLLPEEIRNKIVKIKKSQEQIITVANGNQEIYLNSFMNAVGIGYSDILGRAQNHPALIKELNAEMNSAKVLLATEAAFGLKYFTESNMIGKLKNMLDDIREIEILINQEIKLE
jgi:hypothetical protein